MELLSTYFKPSPTNPVWCIIINHWLNNYLLFFWECFNYCTIVPPNTSHTYNPINVNTSNIYTYSSAPKSMVVLPYQVACVDISPLGGQGDIKAEICAIGFWTELSVSILRLPTLQVMDKQLLGGGKIGYYRGCYRILGMLWDVMLYDIIVRLL